MPTAPAFELANVGPGPDPCSLSALASEHAFVLVLLQRDHYCTNCRQQVQQVASRYHEFASRDAEVTSVVPEPREKVEEWQDAYDLPYPLLADPDVPLSFSLVRTADVVTAADDPMRISADLVSLVERATHVEMYTSVLLPDVVDAVADRVTESDLTLTVYVDDGVVSSLLRDYGDTIERVLPSEAVTLATVPDGHPFDVAVYTLADGERVAAVVCGSGVPTALLLNSSEGALAWANERLDAIADRATPVP